MPPNRSQLGSFAALPRPVAALPRPLPALPRRGIRSAAAWVPGLIAGLAMLAAAPAADAQTLAVVGATVIDGTGRAPVGNGVVLSVDGKVAEVGTVGSVAVPPDATVVDAAGKYVVPGLMDANLHLFLNIDLETLIKHEGRYHDIVLEAAQIALKSGQTTVFDTWGPREALATAREMINRGEAPGSRIYLAGNIIGFDGPLSADFRAQAAAHVSKAFVSRTNERWEQGTGRALLWMPPDSVRPIIRTYARKGVDFLKYGASGHVEMSFLSFSPAVQRAIVEEGHGAGMTVQTHTTSVESFDMAVEAGVDIVTHCGISGPTHPLPLEYVQKMVDRGTACSVLPITQRRLDALQREAPDGVLATYMKVAKVNHRNMIEAGATLLVSTDAGIENPVLRAESATLAADTVDPRVKLGEGHFNALAALEEMGMDPMEILKSATAHVAGAYKVDDLLGTLEPGKAADMLVLDADPLESTRNYRRIYAVIKGGAIVDRDALPAAPRISSLKPSGPPGVEAVVSFAQVADTVPADPAVEAMIAPYRSQLEAHLTEVLAQATGLFAKADPEGALDNLVADAVLHGARRLSRDTVHVVLVNDGGLRVPVAAGPILMRHTYELLPFENYITVLELTGVQLDRLADQVAQSGGEPVAGWTMVLDGEDATRVLVGGVEIDPQATYRLATVDYLADGGGSWSVLWEPSAHEGREDMTVLIRDVFVDYLRERGVVSPELDGRIRREGEGRWE